jgi:hypothetical protein
MDQQIAAEAMPHTVYRRWLYNSITMYAMTHFLPEPVPLDGGIFFNRINVLDAWHSTGPAWKMYHDRAGTSVGAVAA